MQQISSILDHSLTRIMHEVGDLDYGDAFFKRMFGTFLCVRHVASYIRTMRSSLL